MSGGWTGSTRRDRLPRDWHRTRARIRRRDGNQCTAIEDGTRCTGNADHVDHITNAAAGGTEDDTNLRSLCAHHHGLKSSAEGNAAKAALRHRPTPQHPGLIA